MSCNYADGLSPYENKGVLGVAEKFDAAEVVEEKCKILADWILQSKHVVVHTGAGISTAAGIPDFRSPTGVWTLEKKGLKPQVNISFDDAIPTKTHMAIKKLVDKNYVQFIISQNIDGLHLKTGLSREAIAELHGNMFVEKCNTCQKQFIRNSATTSVGQKSLNTICKGFKLNGRPCRGCLQDTILDWEANLPEVDLHIAEYHSNIADLSICLGSTLQIVPSGKLPALTKKNEGKLVIVNLQPTKQDKKADLMINSYVDEVFVQLMKHLQLEIPDYSQECDPTKSFGRVMQWSFHPVTVRNIRKSYEAFCKNAKKRKMIERLAKQEIKKEKKLSDSIELYNTNDEKLLDQDENKKDVKLNENFESCSNEKKVENIQENPSFI